MLIRLTLVVTLTASLATADETRSAKEALQPFNDLIGSWRGTGTPAGSRAEQQKNFWVETMAWQWQFRGKDAWLKVDFDKSKHFTTGELRYVPEQGVYGLKVKDLGGDTASFTGRLEKRVLSLEREDKGETQRIVITLLHPNRFLYRYETRPAGKTLFAAKYQVGATKEGVPFADGDGRPECVVSGGVGTSAVMYQGKTYYVCCSGCRTEFQENPEKYVKEFEAKKRGAK
jgi:hypothetical protein